MIDNDDQLREAIRKVDLPQLISEYYPDSKARSGKAGSIKASWRDDKNPSASVYKSDDGVWLFKDFATPDGGNVYHFLTQIMGYPEGSAIEYIKLRAGIKPDSFGKFAKRPPKKPLKKLADSAKEIISCENKPIDPKILEAYNLQAKRLVPELPLALQYKGFILEDMYTLRIAASRSDAVLPIFNPEGEIVALKKKLFKNDALRYMYLTEGHGAPAWCSPDFMSNDVVIVMEGEINAMITHLALKESGYNVGVMGVAGTNGYLHLYALKGKTVYVYADDDEPGRLARERWISEALASGAKKAEPLDSFEFPLDACDVANKGGKKGLVRILTDTIAEAYKFTKIVADYSRIEMVESLNKYLDGVIKLPLGFPEIDEETGGLAESGIILIGADSSCGKSVLMRDILYNLFDQRNVKSFIFSPDQSATSIARLYTGKLIGVSAKSVKSKSFSKEMLDIHGSPEKILSEWRKTYAYVINELLSNIAINESITTTSELIACVNKALDDGYRVFAGDYLQLFRTDSASSNSVEDVSNFAEKVKAFTRGNRIPFIFTAQLAKYKLDAKSNMTHSIPDRGDIEGKGNLTNLAEQIFLIYRWKHHAYHFGDRADVTDNAEGINEKERARLYVAKDKESSYGYYKFLEFYNDIPEFRPYNKNRVPITRF